MRDAAPAGEWALLAGEISDGGLAKGDNDFGADDVDLLEEEWDAGVGFVGLGGAVLRGPALDDIGDVDLFALEAHGGDHVVEELATPAYEGQALGVFVRAGALADEHELGVGVAVAEDELVAAFGELAARAVADLLADKLEGGEVLRGWDGVARGWDEAGRG